MISKTVSSGNVSRLDLLVATALGLNIAVVILGCCPIPISSQNPVTPEAEVTVFEVTQQEPVKGAEVRIERRDGRPGSVNPVDFETKKTDGSGHVSFEARTASETETPWMMHGVPHYYWTLCVRHQDFETVAPAERFSEREIEDGERWDVTVELEPGESTPCKDAAN